MAELERISCCLICLISVLRRSFFERFFLCVFERSLLERTLFLFSCRALATDEDELEEVERVPEGDCVIFNVSEELVELVLALALAALLMEVDAMAVSAGIWG